MVLTLSFGFRCDDEWFYTLFVGTCGSPYLVEYFRVSARMLLVFSELLLYVYIVGEVEDFEVSILTVLIISWFVTSQVPMSQFMSEK